MSEKDLTEELLKRHPVWKWDEEMEGHVPVADYDPLPIDEGTLFIRAKFCTKSGDQLGGYLVGTESFYAIGIFAEGEEFVLNLRLPDLAQQSLSKLRRLLGSPSLVLFPLEYVADVELTQMRRPEGVLVF